MVAMDLNRLRARFTCEITNLVRVRVAAERQLHHLFAASNWDGSLCFADNAVLEGPRHGVARGRSVAAFERMLVGRDQ
jgi:hypothetical protein